MNIQHSALKMTTALLIFVLWTFQSANGAGLTIVTHGFQLSPFADYEHGWVHAMTDYVADRAGGNAAVYNLFIESSGAVLLLVNASTGGKSPTESQNAEVIIRVFWDERANHYFDGTDSTFVAEWALDFVVSPPAYTGLTHPLSELPIHLIGHSRGGSVVSEIARLLGEKGIWTHQMTTLDPHPVSSDAPVHVWETVLFADNYYQTNPLDDIGDPVDSPVDPDGQFVNGAFNRYLEQSVLANGRGSQLEHVDVHFWYHGTINTDPAASDGSLTFNSDLRENWYFSSEDRGQQAGFYYSRLGGGVVSSLGSGYYNNGDFNNSPANRISLTRNANEWPSLITLTHDSISAVKAGSSFPIRYVFQSFDSSSSVTLYLDTDQNPYNNGGIQLGFNQTVNPQPLTQRGTRTIDANVTVPAGTTPKSYYLYGKITNPNGTRYLYSLAQIRVDPAGTSAPSAPATLFAVAVSSSQINLSWGNVANESGFKIERRLGSSGSWSQISTRSANVTSYSDTGLAAGTAYSYRVRAYNAAGDSAYSPIDSATTQPAAGTTYTLTITSSNPSSGVSVWTCPDNGACVSGTTPVSRSFATGTFVEVSFASTFPSGLYFQKWLLDGDDLAFTTRTGVTMNGAHTLTAVFGNAPPPPRVLSSLAIEGPPSVDERTTAQYQARATYTDGSSAYVNAEWDDDTSYASISNAGLLDTDAVSSDKDIEIEATFTAGGVTKTRTKDVTIRNTDEVPTYTLTLSAQNGHITPSPNMNSYPAGTEVRLTAYPDDGYVRSHWSGDASGTDRTIYITMNRNKSVTAHFVWDTSSGRLQVNLSPPEAVANGAQWRYDLFTTWLDSGEVQDDISPRTDRYVRFKDVHGWMTPDEIKASIIGGQTTVVNATYQEIPGSVQVTLSPEQARAAGARWRLDGGEWQLSDTTVNGVPSGTHRIEFQSIPGWSAPAEQQITVARAGITIRTVQYTPPIGLPLITAVSPKTGPIEGGTLLTIEGANFLPSSSVSVGGRAASNVTFVSAARLTAIAPPSPVFGSAEIVVTSGTSSATHANAFAYGIPRGTNMTLITSSGGLYQAVACNNQHLFIGQGTTLSIFDISTPSSPVFRGSVAVPGRIQDIALSGSVAVVAANDAGVHVVDVANVAAPVLRGFYSTQGPAYALELLAGKAYVVDIYNGLAILDVTNPDGPVALSTLILGSETHWDIALKASAAGFHAYVAASDKVYVIEIADPRAPAKLAEITITDRHNWSIALAGNLALVGHLNGGIGAIDISDPANPVNVGPLLSENRHYVTVASAGNRVVLGGWTQSFDIADVSGTNVTLRGSLSNGDVSFSPSAGQRMAISDNKVWIAAEKAVFGVDISNPDAPQRIFRKDDQGGRFEKVASFGSNVVGATPGKVFGFNFSGSTLTSTASLSTQGGSNPYGFFFYGDTLFDVNNGRFERFELQSNGSLTPLTSLTVPNVSPSDAYFNGSRLLSIGQTYPGDGHAVITEHDLSGANWILQQKHLSFIAAGGGVQIAGAQNVFFVAYIEPPSYKWNLASYNWSADTPMWQIGGFEGINALQLSHNNRFLHVGERYEYRIYDVMNPANPVSLSISDTTNDIRDIVIDGDEAYLAGSGQGVLVYDISDKSQPHLTRSYDTPGLAFSLARIGNRLMVADYTAGIQVLGVPDVVPPQIFITAPVALPEFQTTNSVVTLGGGAEDDSGQISRVTWSNDRSGGDVAQGTTDWSVSVVTLQPGTNVLTVTAFDADGNSTSDQITIIFTPQDTTVPVIAITGPNSDDEFVVETELLTLSGSAVDNQAVATVTWSNERGGSGAANLTGQTWSVTDLPLALGPNLVQVTATDFSGNSASDTAVIFFTPPDTTAPSIGIEFPTLNATYVTEFSMLNLSGVATDNSGVANVEWSNDRGEQGIATGIAPWSVNDIALQLGLNVIEVTATDHAGNSSSDTLSMIFAIPEPPTVTLAIDRTSLAEDSSENPATVTAMLSAIYSQPVTVDLGFSGSATDIDDYTHSGDSIVIPAGEAAGSIAIDAVEDSIDELDEMVAIDIVALTNATEQGTQQVTIIIVDDDVDIEAPVVAQLNPADDATDVPVDANLAITFDEAVQKGAGELVIRRTDSGTEFERVAASSDRVATAGSVATVNPQGKLAYLTDYYVEVAAGAYTDLAGNPYAGLSGSDAWNFTTTACPGLFADVRAGHWTMDEASGTTVADSSGNGNNGVATNGPTTMTSATNPPAKFGNARLFDGVNDFIEVTNGSSLNFTTRFTISAWVRPTAAKLAMIVNNEGRYEIAMFEDRTFQFAVANSTPGWGWVSTGASLPLNEWTHIALTYDDGAASNQLRAYVNGTQVFATAGSGAIGDALPNLNQFRIGGRSYNNSEFFAGGIDDVQVFNRALSAAEIETVFENASLTFTHLPPDITISCTAIADPANPDLAVTGEATASTTDPCALFNPPTVSYVDSPSASVCPRTIVRTWKANDGINTITGVQTITVTDTAAPVLTDPADVTVQCHQTSPGTAENPGLPGFATATDCNTVTIAWSDVVSDISSTCLNAYTIARTWRATDVCGNVSTANQLIAVQDTTDPIFADFPENVVIECDDSLNATAVSTALSGQPTATDNCTGTVTISFNDDIDPPYVCPATITRTWTADDGCGNAVTMNQMLSIKEDLISATPVRAFQVTVEAKIDGRHPQYRVGSDLGYAIDGNQGKALYLLRGRTYTFHVNNTTTHSFYISTSAVGGGAGVVTNGVGGDGNFIENGTLEFTPDVSTPDLLYYQCGHHPNMGWKMYILDAPTAQLITTEDGDSSMFNVALGKAPSANVTVAVTSNDVSEGTADDTTLIFTPGNWNVAQSVVIRGMNDNQRDGSQAYTITVSAASADMAFDGLSEELAVLNLDRTGLVQFQSIDVDGNGRVEALTDGMLVLRYSFGFRGNDLTEGAIGQGCTRCDAPAIEAYLGAMMP